MPTLSQYPRMAALTGDEVLLGSKSDATQTVTVQELANFTATQSVAGVSSINGQSGALTLNAGSVGADPAGSATTAESNAVAAARDALDLHRLSDTAHSKAQVGLGNVDNTSDANKPISTAAQAALDKLTTDVAGKLNAGPADGVLRGVQDGTLVVIPGATGNTVQKLEQAAYDDLASPDPDVIYVRVANTNKVTSDFSSGWTLDPNTSLAAGVLTLTGTASGDQVYALSGPAGKSWIVSFEVEDHIKANITAGFRTDGTLKLGTTRQGTASPGTDAVYTETLSPSGGDVTAFVLRCNVQDGTRDAKVKNISVKRA
jgi:hypothetical protein